MAPQAEAPLHAECGFYAAAVCPYLARPTARRSTDTVLDPRGSLRPENVQLRRVDGYTLVESPEFGFGFQYGRVLEVVVVEAEVQAAQRLAILMCGDLPARAPAPTAWTSGADGVIREAQRVIRRLFPHLASSLASSVSPTPRGDVRRSKRKAQGAARKTGRKKR